MDKNTYKGKLIAIDGPNGVGKSTIIKNVEEKMKARGYDVYITKEPTDTELGHFVRSFAEKKDGVSLACLVAADRYEHLENEIKPMLEKGAIVVTDRYILSSLVLQRMDNVSTSFILDLNNKILIPDLQIALFVDEKVLQRRLSEREILTRFEQDNQSNCEIRYLNEGICLLKDLQVRVEDIYNNDNLDENVEKIISCIVSLYEEKR